MSLDPLVLATVAGMALVTAWTRLAGLWLIRRYTLSGRLSGALEAVPGAILIALVAPVALATGPAESAAALVTLLLAWRLPLIVAVAGGVASVVLLRGLLM